MPSRTPPNLILARTIRREGELGIRAALGASTGALRRVLLADSLLLCGAGAALGVLSARPMVAILARYASRFSVRALDLTVDFEHAGRRRAAGRDRRSAPGVCPQVALRWTPAMDSVSQVPALRITGSANRRLRIFAVTQIAASFLLLAGAGTLLKTLLALQRAHRSRPASTCWPLMFPWFPLGSTSEQTNSFYKEAIRRIGELPGVDRVAIGDHRALA